MFENLDVFQMAGAMARHASHRQAVISGNIANADTPGYVPRDITPFSEINAAMHPRDAMRATRPGHILVRDPALGHAVESRAGFSGALNGNGVSIEQEMVRSVEAKRQHSRAISIYKSALNVLRTSLGRG